MERDFQGSKQGFVGISGTKGKGMKYVPTAEYGMGPGGPPLLRANVITRAL